MVLLHRLFALPPALLTLVLERSCLAQSKELEWPYNLPAHVKYYPEDESLVKRNVEVRQKLQHQTPVGMRKMSGDPGEMFFLDYWRFEMDDHDTEDGGSSNISKIAQLTAPLKLHADSIYQGSILPRFLARTLFEKRDFQCPTGSTACISINRPNSCCGTGATCQIVQDTGLGDVGCCPENQVCSGSVSTCPADHISCPQNPGGGCCVPGYACFDVGCVATSTVVVTVIPSTTSTPSTSPSSSSSTPLPAAPSTATQTETQTQIQTQTQTQVQTQTQTQVQTQTQTQIQTQTDTTIVVPVLPTTTTATTTASLTATTDTTDTTDTTATITTTTTTQNIITTTTTSSSSPSSSSDSPNVLVCSSGFRSCPASLGGGCCPTDRACGRDLCPALSSTNTFAAPARPTSNSVATGFTTIPGAECPTGFYACSAFYQGGCCQTGRDCQPTSCPPGASITVVAGSSVTIDAPTGSGISSVMTLLTGSCASGWSTCATNVGGGCCPSGYACGTACTATATGGQDSVVGKIAPNEAGKTLDTRKTWILMGGSLVSVAILFGYFA